MTTSPLAEQPNAQSARARQFRFVVVLGAPGTGKTSLVDEWIGDYRARGRSVRILDPANQWPGVGEWPKDGNADAWILALREQRRSPGSVPPPLLLVLDDADLYLGGSSPKGPWRDLITTFRHWRVDVILSARRTQDVPKIALTSASTVALFVHREVHARNYMASYLGRDVVAKIPRVPHRYLLVDVDKHEMTEGSTKKRAQRVAADM